MSRIFHKTFIKNNINCLEDQEIKVYENKKNRHTSLELVLRGIEDIEVVDKIKDKLIELNYNVNNFRFLPDNDKIIVDMAP